MQGKGSFDVWRYNIPFSEVVLRVRPRPAGLVARIITCDTYACS